MKIKERIESPGIFEFFCPGCKMVHQINTKTTTMPFWSFNNSLDAPTISPSILVRMSFKESKPQKICHSYIKEGKIEFLSDSTHALSGKTVTLDEIDWIYS